MEPAILESSSHQKRGKTMSEYQHPYFTPRQEAIAEILSSEDLCTRLMGEYADNREDLNYEGFLDWAADRLIKEREGGK